MSLFSSSRCVLIMGDEGLQVYNVGRLSAKLVDVVPWNTVEFEVSVRDLIIKKCKRKPIVVLNDMVEQHYRKERIPKVSFFDRANVLKRRLGVAFPNYKIRAALKLDDKVSGLPKDGKKGASYLFAAVSASDSFSKTMKAIHISNAPIVGFYLLPVESSVMVQTLASKLSKGKRAKAAWTIFMGQHQGGGVRQIVIRNGELALTRVTPIVDTDVEPDLWVKEILGELSATMSYLSRFGYEEADGLNIIIVANDGMEKNLEAVINQECNLHVLNSSDAGKLLSVNVGQYSDLRYADPLHAAYLGKKKRFRLPMQVASIDQMKKPRQVAFFLIMALIGACGYLGYQSFVNFSRLSEVKEELRVAGERKKSIQQEYNLELEKKKKIGFDFLLVNNSVELFKELGSKKTKPLLLLKEVGKSLGADLHLDKITVKSVALKGQAQAQAQAQDPYANSQQQKKKNTVFLEAVMTLSFDSGLDPDVGVNKTNELLGRLQNRLPNYEVKIIKQVADLSYTGNFIGEAGETSSQNGEPKDYESEIYVRGPLP